MRAVLFSSVVGLTDSLPRMADDIRNSFENPDPPRWLPTPQVVVCDCKAHGCGPAHLVIHSPDGLDLVFAKYGPSISMGEARTQHLVATSVNSDEDVVVLVPRVYYAFRYKRDGYIVMEYIDGSDCEDGDFDAIARAVRRLWSIPSPTTSPGPVGNGPVSHRLFYRGRSDIRYDSVEALQSHINSVSSALALFTSIIYLGQPRYLPVQSTVAKSASATRISNYVSTIFTQGISAEIRAADLLPSTLGKPTFSLLLFKISLSPRVAGSPGK